MDSGDEAALLAAVRTFIGGRDSRKVLNDLYHLEPFGTAEALAAVADSLPIEQISTVRLVDKLNLSGLPAVVVLLAVLRRLRTEDAWVHYNLAKHLGGLCEAGVAAAKLPAIVHSLLACEGLRDTANAQPLPLGVLTRELAAFAPREAIRRGMVAARHGDAAALPRSAPAFAALGLEEIKERVSVGQLLQTAKELRLAAADIPDLPQATRLDKASGLRTAAIEPPRQISFPGVGGDASHYIFGAAEQPVQLPGIVVHALEGGTFSIDATMRGLERHYVFDRNGDCVLDFANGSAPFVAETVIESDVPVAILDDRFSGVLNICHFLLDRVTRIPLYERAWARPGKFFLVDDYPYCRDIFFRLGLSDRVVIPPAKRVSIRAPELLFSSNIAADFRHPAHYCADWAIGYLRGALRIVERPASPGRKLMISRADTTGRGIINWDEVRSLLERRGFEIVELSGLSTAAQMALFGDASQVVGVHGAGLTNILFAPRNCAVLEILPPLSATQAYWLLASSLGQSYFALIADDAEMPRPDYQNWRHQDIYNLRDIIIPIDRLEAALASLDGAAHSAAVILRSGETTFRRIGVHGQGGAPAAPATGVWPDPSHPQPDRKETSRSSIRGPVKAIPDQLFSAYTMGGVIPVQDFFFDNSVAEDHISWTAESFEEFRASARACIAGERDARWERYPADPFLIRLLKRHSIAGQSVLIIGSEVPFYEALVIEFGGHPTTVEYRRIDHDIKGLNTLTVDEFAASNLLFDCAVSISSIEHAGLGRYGDLLDPDGDLKAMALCRRHLKPGGLMFLHVPVGPDALAWNAHRIYGALRLPMLLAGWRQVDAEGYDEGMLTRGEPGMHDYPVFVLRNDSDQRASAGPDGAGRKISPGPVAAQPASRDVPLVNVALHKPAIQSSDSGHRCPSKRVGGNATSGLKTGGFGFHTDIEPEPWWMVDLQRVHDIRRVVVYNRETAVPERADTMSVSVGLQPDGPWREIHRCHGRFGGVLSNNPLVVSLEPPVPARYVRLHLNATEFFHLDEVEVYAPPAPHGLDAARIAEVFGLRGAIPAGQKPADSNVVNSEGWSWAAFCGRYHLDPTAIRREWSGRKLRFDFDPGTPFDGEVGALRIEPVGGIGNVFYDIVNACLIARSLGCTAVEVPPLEGGVGDLPVEVDGIRIATVGLPTAGRPTLVGSFYWPTGFEPLMGQYNSEFLVDTIDRFVRPVFGNFLRAAGDLGDDVLVMHFRGGDIFLPGGTHGCYVQPPASFYKKAVAFAMTRLGVSSVRMVYQDRTNPSVDLVEEFLRTSGIPYSAQSASVFDDVATLLGARHLVAAYGTFCELAAMLSSRLATYIGFRTIATQAEINFWAESRVADVLRARSVDVVIVTDVDGLYIPPATWANTPAQIELMRRFPEDQLTIEGIGASSPLLPQAGSTRQAACDMAAVSSPQAMLAMPQAQGLFSNSDLLEALGRVRSQYGGDPAQLEFFEAIRRVAHDCIGIGVYSEETRRGECSALSWAAAKILQRKSIDYRPVVFDVGANVGDYALDALSVFEQLKLFCFEPSSAAFSTLREHVTGSDRREVRLYRLALSSRTGDAQLYANHPGSPLASLYRRNMDHIGLEFDFCEHISSVTLDQFCREHEIDHIDFLKIDTEGAELEVLSGASNLLKNRAIDFIQFEFGGTQIDSRVFFRDLWTLLKDYSIYRIMARGLGKIPSYSENLEIFEYQNFLAELKN